ncbi:MAG: hypothetical protein FWD69_02875 [Polyangiaceae bacterium]|nr:hypothetical protein [Polyangiaceae bacterium]
MKHARKYVLALVLAAAPVGGVFVASDACASVSTAVAFDALVSGAEAIAVVTPIEKKSVWENGRIYTYTHVKTEQSVAGALTSGSDGWVRTMGGVVDKIGQLVEGEAVFTPGESSMVFLRKWKAGGTWEVTARAQGQYPVVVDSTAKIRKIVHSARTGAVLPAKTAGNVRLAADVLHERTLDDAAHEVASAWQRLHPK